MLARYRALLRMLLPWSELNDPNNPLSELGQQAVQGICRVRPLVPFLFTEGLEGSVQPGIRVAPGRFWDRLCQPYDPPGSTVEPIGGQCDGVLYDARAFNPSGTLVPWVGSGGGGSIPGRMVTFDVELAVQDPDNPGKFRQLIARFMNEDMQLRSRALSDPGGAYLYDSSWSVELYRIDGLPDNCDAPPPPPPPPVPPPNEYEIPITINNILNRYQIGLPEFDVGDWPDFTFRPVIDLGGVRAEFSLGGINFPDINFPEWPETPLVEVNLTPTLNAIADLDVVLQAGLGNISIQVEGIRGGGDVDLTELENLIRCCACEEGVTYESATVSISTGGGSFPLPSNCVAVVVIAALPLTEKTPTISRSGTEDDRYLWGTVAISYALGSAGVVERLSYQSQSIPVAENAQIVTVTPHYGNTCSIIAVIKSRNCE